MAEIDKAIELAKIETDKALMALRFFSPSSLFFTAIQYFGRMGQINVPSPYMFLYYNDESIINEGTDSSQGINYHIGTREVNAANKAGLLSFSKLLEKENSQNLRKLFY